MKLFFIGTDRPQLDRIEFHADSQPDKKFGFLQRGYGSTANSFTWREMPQALSLFFLEYLNATPPGKQFLFRRTEQTATLADAITKRNGKIFTLFQESLSGREIAYRVDMVFDGDNLHGKNTLERTVSVNTDYLPQDCVEIYFDRKPLPPDKLQKFTEHFRKAWKLPPPSEPAFLKEDEVNPAKQEPAGQPAAKEPSPVPKSDSSPTPAREPFQPELKEQQPPATVPGPTPQAEETRLSKLLAQELAQALDTLRGQPQSKPASEETPSQGQAATAKQSSTAEAESDSPKPDFVADRLHFELKAQPGREKEEEETTPTPPIDRRLFEIHNPEHTEWDDSDGLINFTGDDSEADLWRIRDASEGLLIFGAVGSGKTSGSGAAFARAYLQAGFGGLVMTAKPDEARRWLRMCRETGRAGDCVHVTPGSGRKLNFLQYETQRPGERIAVTDDLIALFRCLLGVMSRSKGDEPGEVFWTNTTNQLMRKLIDIFLLAGEPLTLNRLVRFIHVAPRDEDKDWRNIRMFASLITRAGEAANDGTDEDKRIYQEAFEYWTEFYPTITEATRSGFITGFTAMADTLSGRGIYEMIGTETNLTPEMILSGKIVILDVPLKGNIQGGLMVQSIWKLLFQQAVERRADKGRKTARPAFLWEDEGHLFFSHHDVNFQPSARDCRAPHVILSQNIHNFLHLGHSEHSVHAVFSAMNTYIFHTNGDLETNQWASAHVGAQKKLKLTTDGLLKPMKDKDISFFTERRPEEVENVGKFILAEETKQSVPPEDFAKLKRGGDGTCEALIVWLSHRFAANRNRNFCVLTFEQEQQTT